MKSIASLILFLSTFIVLIGQSSLLKNIEEIEIDNGSFDIPQTNTSFTQVSTIPDFNWSYSSGAPPYIIKDGPNQLMLMGYQSHISKDITIEDTGAYRIKLRMKSRNGNNPLIMQIFINDILIKQVDKTENEWTSYNSVVRRLNQNEIVNLRIQTFYQGGDVNPVEVDDVIFEKIPTWKNLISHNTFDPNTWNINPSETTDVIIPNGMAIAVLHSVHAKSISVEGELLSIQNSDVRIHTDRIFVHQNGYVEFGQEHATYQNHAVINLTGDSTDPDFIHGAHNMGTKCIGVMGQLQIHGNNKQSHGLLAETAIAGESSIIVSGFSSEAINLQDEILDQVVIASTNYDMNEAEVHTVVGVMDLGNGYLQLNLMQPLTYSHFGELQEFSSSLNGNSWTLDERAEVGILTKNIVIQGDESSETDLFGGHIMIMMNGQAHVDGVELYRMGQAGQLGRYPFHWHTQESSGTGQYIINSSIHHSFNRAITIHATHNTLVDNNVAYDILGHCYFFEDGVEEGNTMTNNLGILTKAPAIEHRLLPSDDLLHRNMSGPSTFWITNPKNVVTNNRAAGSAGSGFWFAPFSNPNGILYEASYNPRYMDLTGSFDNNLAHSNYHGFIIGVGPDLNDFTQTPNPNSGWLPNSVPVFKNITLYKNKLASYSRTNKEDLSRYENFIVADNYAGDATTWITEYDKVLWVGASQNAEPKPAGNNPANGNFAYAHTHYDGPVKVTNSHFAGMDVAGMSIIDGWGANHKFTGFSFENTSIDGPYTIKFRDNDFEPVFFNNVSYDKDGLLTNTSPMTAIVQDHPMLIDQECFSTSVNANSQFCPHRYAYIEMRPTGEIYFPSIGQKRRPYSSFMRSDGAYSVDRGIAVIGIGLVPMLNGEYDYTFNFEEEIPNRTRLDIYSMMPDEFVIIQFPNMPQNLSVMSGVPGIFAGGTPLFPIPQTSTLTSLENATSTSWYYNQNENIGYLKIVGKADIDWESDEVQECLFLCLQGNCSIGSQTITVSNDSDGDGKSNKNEFLLNRNPFDVTDLGFEFSTSNDAEGWTCTGDILECDVEYGKFILTVSGEDPKILHDGFSFLGDEIDRIAVRAKTQFLGSYTMQWLTESNGNVWSSLTVSAAETNTIETIRFNVSGDPNWDGQIIKHIRFIIPNTPGNIVEILWIKGIAINSGLIPPDEDHSETDCSFSLQEPIDLGNTRISGLVETKELISTNGYVDYSALMHSAHEINFNPGFEVYPGSVLFHAYISSCD